MTSFFSQMKDTLQITKHHLQNKIVSVYIKYEQNMKQVIINQQIKRGGAVCENRKLSQQRSFLKTNKTSLKFSFFVARFRRNRGLHNW